LFPQQPSGVFDALFFFPPLGRKLLHQFPFFLQWCEAELFSDEDENGRALSAASLAPIESRPPFFVCDLCKEFVFFPEKRDPILSAPAP